MSDLNVERDQLACGVWWEKKERNSRSFEPLWHCAMQLQTDFESTYICFAMIERWGHDRLDRSTVSCIQKLRH